MGGVIEEDQAALRLPPNTRSLEIGVTDEPPLQPAVRSLVDSFETIDHADTLEGFDGAVFRRVGLSLSGQQQQEGDTARGNKEKESQKVPLPASVSQEGHPVTAPAGGATIAQTGSLGTEHASGEQTNQVTKLSGAAYWPIKLVLLGFVILTVSLSWKAYMTDKQTMMYMKLYKEETQKTAALAQKLANLEAILEDLRESDLRHKQALGDSSGPPLSEGSTSHRRISGSNGGGRSSSRSSPRLSREAEDEAAASNKPFGECRAERKGRGRNADWKMENCHFSIKAGPCTAKSLTALREGIEDGVASIRRVISSSEPALRSVVDNVVQMTEVLTKGIFGDADQKASDKDRQMADPVGDIFAGIDNIFQRLSGHVGGGGCRHRKRKG